MTKYQHFLLAFPTFWLGIVAVVWSEDGGAEKPEEERYSFAVQRQFEELSREVEEWPELLALKADMEKAQIAYTQAFDDALAKEDPEILKQYRALSDANMKLDKKLQAGFGSATTALKGLQVDAESVAVVNSGNSRPTDVTSLTYFDVVIKTEGVSSNVNISFHVKKDSPFSAPPGKPPCKRPMLAQIVKTTQYNRFNSWFSSDDWKIDGGDFYEHQTVYPYSASMEDFPGLNGPRIPCSFDGDSFPIVGPSWWIFGIRQDFETVAICTDDGPGKFWIIGAVRWGHIVGGIHGRGNWGGGYWLPLPASAEFKRLFPKGWLEK